MPYIVQTASCHMRGKAKNYRYEKVAVLEVLPGVTKASMIATRSKDVIRIVSDSGAMRYRSEAPSKAWWAACDAANQLAAELNEASPK